MHTLEHKSLQCKSVSVSDARHKIAQGIAEKYVSCASASTVDMLTLCVDIHNMAVLRNMVKSCRSVTKMDQKVF